VRPHEFNVLSVNIFMSRFAHINELLDVGFDIYLRGV
jgi:hypothetical protein